MTKRKRNRVERKRSLEPLGWGLRSEERDTVKCHTGDETLLHYHLKAEVVRQFNNNKSTVFTEVSNGDGIADVLALRENQHPNALIIEIETDLTEEKRKEKINTFYGEMIQEVLVWDPQEFSTSLHHLQQEVEERLDGFI